MVLDRCLRVMKSRRRQRARDKRQVVTERHQKAMVNYKHVQGGEEAAKGGGKGFQMPRRGIQLKEL